MTKETKQDVIYASDDSKHLGGGIYSFDLPPIDADNVTAKLSINHNKETKRVIRRGNVSYELIYINKVPSLVLVKEAGKTKALPVDILKELLKDSY